MATMDSAVAQAPSVIYREVNLREAAQLSRRSIDTLRRRLWADKIPGAHRDGESQESPWVIPVAGLVEAGLVTAADLLEFDHRVDQKYAQLEERVAELSAELAQTRLRLETTERLLAQANGEVEHHRRVTERLLPVALVPSSRGMS